MKLREKILERVKVTSAGCWEWQGAKNDKGYGQVWDKESRKVVYCHRTMANAPKGSVVLHSCDNPICCNPEHLKVGTQAENQADMAAKGRAHRGYKLSDESVLEIEASSESGVSLAKRYGVSQQTICDIRKGRRHDKIIRR